jgi:oxygen-independent coproporphyrinogen III oxidase
MTSLARVLEQTPYQSYVYAYPHKTAYRVLDQPVSLRAAWAEERRDALFLYMHIPFCEMRCGFCNLFTTVNPKGDLEALYLETLERQARRVQTALGAASFARLAIGGGTPTYLKPADLHRLFDIAEQIFGAAPQAIPVSVETSPKTADRERLRVLRERGVDRISIGVQSFFEHEAAAAGRPQTTAAVETALERIRALGFPTLNIDLIYGIGGQTVASWLASLRAALRYQPEELYLYPLYVRPLTGLGRQGRAWDDSRLACYRAGRDFLLSQGYEQVSMRMFRAAHASALDGPVYCCQEDGMVGLGCGARSYTHRLHYSSEYAVGASGVRAILQDYIARDDESFDSAHYGYLLSEEDMRQRYVIQSLLQADGLERAAYQRRFACDALSDLPQLFELVEHDLATLTQERLKLTERGLELSDAIGPWLYTAQVQALMEAYELR